MNGEENPNAKAEATESLPAVLAANELTSAQASEDMATLNRDEHLPTEAGWLFICVGVLGIVLPGIIGAPFLIAGADVVTPGGRKRLARRVGARPPKFVHASLRQIGRMLDYLERRYPRIESSPLRENPPPEPS